MFRIRMGEIARDRLMAGILIAISVLFLGAVAFSILEPVSLFLAWAVLLFALSGPEVGLLFMLYPGIGRALRHGRT